MLQQAMEVLKWGSGEKGDRQSDKQRALIKDVKQGGHRLEYWGRRETECYKNKPI